MERIDTVREEARRFFGNVDPSHDWNHVQRVRKMALKLAEEEDADREVVELSAVLHDIGRKKEDMGEIDHHEVWGAEKAEEILEETGYSQNLIEDVKHCIKSHRYSRDPEPETLEAKILSDADNLDSLGATGIARTFCYAGDSKEPLFDPENPPEEDKTEKGETSLNHLENRILKVKDRIYTEAGKRMAEERHRFVEEYTERFREELQIH